MSPLLAISQRVAVTAPHNERRDMLDQRWHGFLAACGVAGVPLPNHPETAMELLGRLPIHGVILTGGNTLAAYGGDAPERDQVEAKAVAFAMAQKIPVLGVCRGMQVVLDLFGVKLRPVDGHAGTQHEISGQSPARTVNSFHDFAAIGDAGSFQVLARSADGVVEEITDPDRLIHGIMWHPERESRFNADDIALVRRMFNRTAP